MVTYKRVVPPSLGTKILQSLRRMFLSGILITIPLIVTFYVLNFLFQQVDGLLSPVVSKVFGYSVPGMGLIATILLIILIGILGRNVMGLRLVAMGERLINRMPIARTIHSAAKQLMEAVTSPKHQRFNRVVLIEYPRRGIFALAFASGQTQLSQNGEHRDLTTVFVPSTPTPVTGFVVMLPTEDILYLSITPEEAIKFLVSGGLASPDMFEVAPSNDVPVEA